MKRIEKLKCIISISIFVVIFQCDFLNAQIIANQRLSLNSSSAILESNYTNLEELVSITDRNPEIFKIDRLRIGKPTDYWFNVALGLELENLELHLETKIEYVRYGTREKNVSEKDSISQFDVYLNSNGIIDSIATIYHNIESASKERIIEVLKTCTWKPALSSLKPVNVNFILEIRFSD